MQAILGPLIFLVSVFILIKIIRELLAPQRKGRWQKNSQNQFPYKIKPTQTEAEQNFFKVLQSVVEDAYYIFPQTHLETLLKITDGGSEWQTHFNKIIKKSVDFVLIDKNTFLPTLVIELDDWRHKTDRRQKRDQFVDEALKTAGIPILHVQAQYNYNIEQIRLNMRDKIINK